MGSGCKLQSRLKDDEDEYDEFEYNDNASFPPPPIHITEPDTDEYKVFDVDDGFQIGGLKKNKKTVVCTTEGRVPRTQNCPRSVLTVRNDS